MKKLLALLVVLALSLFGVSAAFAAYDMKIDEDTYAKFGMKAQIWVQNLEDAAPSGSDNAVDISVKQARLYFAGQVSNLVKFGANYDFAKGNSDTKTTGVFGVEGERAGINDAFITLDFAKEFKVMTGIYRMAVSRVALQDSYTYLLPHSPAVAAGSTLSNMNNFRDAGITAWGDLADGMFRYNVALWDGSYAPAGVNNDGTNRFLGGTADVPSKDTMGKSARLVMNFMDPEKGYTNACCYLGKAKIANVGVGYLMQDYLDAAAAEKTYTVTTVDAYYGVGDLTAEAAYFMYDKDITGNGAKPKSWYVQAGYQIGNIQPALRYESWDNDSTAAAGGDYTQIVAGVNYLIEGHDAKISLEYLMRDNDLETGAVRGATGPDWKDWTLQLQTQF